MTSVGQMKRIESLDELRGWLASLDRFAAAKYWAKQVPRYRRFLYKYASGAPKTLRGAIERSTLWLASRKDFNDPFEMNLRFAEMQGTEDEQVSYFRNAARRLGVPLGKRHATAEKAVKDGRFLDLARESFDAYADAYGVCCFSAHARDVRMWAHYAKQQRGVCYQFHVPHSLVPFAEALRVQYSDEPIEIRKWIDVAARSRQLGNAFLTKTLHWQSEHEYRIVRHDAARTVLPFGPSALVGVILGCAAPRFLQLRVVALCRRRQRAGLPTVRLFRAVPDPSTNRLRIARAHDLEAKVA